MLIPSHNKEGSIDGTSLSRRVNANSQLLIRMRSMLIKLIKKGEC